MALRIGETFAGYRILRLLGSGGMGEVYLVQHPRLPRQDALKVLRPDLSSDPSFRERFIREADLAAGLRHPHIVGIHDRGEHDGQLWIAMDFIDGEDVASLLERKYLAGMPVDRVLPIVTAVASALDYAHKEGLLHRDVKPANIIVSDLDSEEPSVFLADFGIARPADEISGLTTTNMAVGTVAYCAPEQLMGEDIDGRADQYSLAATTYTLLTGLQLFTHSNPAVVISKHLAASPPVPGEIRPEVAALDPVLIAGLAKAPGDRFRRCSDFARALTEQASTIQGSAAPIAPTIPAPIAQGRNAPQSGSVTSRPAPPKLGKTKAIPRWKVAVGIGVALVVGGTLIAIWQRQAGNDLSNSSADTTSVKASVSPTPTSTTTAMPPTPPTFSATAIDNLLLGVGQVNAVVGASTLEVNVSNFGTSDKAGAVTPAACVGVLHGAEQHVYEDSGFLQLRNQLLSPRPNTVSYSSGQLWDVQQAVAVFPTADDARSVLTTSEATWRSCASGLVEEASYEYTAPWTLRNVQVQGDVLKVSMADLSEIAQSGGPSFGACQHALGLRANVIAEAVTCAKYATGVGDTAERIVFAILDKVHV